MEDAIDAGHVFQPSDDIGVQTHRDGFLHRAIELADFDARPIHHRGCSAGPALRPCGSSGNTALRAIQGLAWQQKSRKAGRRALRLPGPLRPASHPRLPVQVAPKTFLQIAYEMLKLLRDRDYSRQGSRFRQSDPPRFGHSVCLRQTFPSIAAINLHLAASRPGPRAKAAWQRTGGLNSLNIATPKNSKSRGRVVRCPWNTNREHLGMEQAADVRYAGRRRRSRI